MVQQLKFARMETSFKGLMNRAIRHFNRYVGEGADTYRWIFIESPEYVARSLEILADDLPEDDLADVVPRMPYLVVLFRAVDEDKHMPVEAALAFLSIINRSGMITILRQCSDRQQLAPSFDLDPAYWSPLLFMCGGVPDLDAEFEGDTTDQCSFF